MTSRGELGAIPLDGNRTFFRIWSPANERLELQIVAPRERRIILDRVTDGYHEITVDDCGAGARYLYRLPNGRVLPDPASRLQPEGVHGPSEVVSRDFSWSDDGWKGVALEDYVVYELHVGTFTEEGTFEAIIPHLDELRELGVTAIELMPIGQFPGTRNWGYDGVYISAAQTSYGGPLGLKRLVDACHSRGLAILIDVVYNHLGPEGNYLSEYGNYFTDRYRTPWGQALNFDGPGSDDVRWFFIHNALTWIEEFHIDGLRVDAVHAIVDHSAEPFLQDLTEAVREAGKRLDRRVYTIAESNLNDPRMITPKSQSGIGFDAQWADDYHHALHTLLTGENDGYYLGYGKVSDLASISGVGYLFVGQYSAYYGRKYGARPSTTDGAKFVVFAQNHDQVGNRMRGERLSALVSPQELRLVAAAVVLSPFVPLLFMGEEYGEKAPFQYFTSHSDADLIEAVRRGRLEEFDDFIWKGDVPDPHDEETFRRSRLDRGLLRYEEHASLRSLYRDLFRMRRETPALRSLNLAAVETHADDEKRVLLVRRGTEGEQVLLAFNLSAKEHCVDVPFAGGWQSMMGEARIDDGRLTLPPRSFGVFALAG